MASKTQNIVFNPLEKKHLGESVGDAFLRQPVLPFADLKPFSGTGIYAIYYTGDFDAYSLIVTRNLNGKFSAPIYVGGAPSNGNFDEESTKSYSSSEIYNQLLQHAKSLEDASNLDLHDFYYRHLVVDDIWIPLGRSQLIAWFDPLWNKLVDGFYNNPGLVNFSNLLPRWDLLHPGRPRANDCLQREESIEQIKRELTDYLRNSIPRRFD
jgi:hypothetical protein